MKSPSFFIINPSANNGKAVQVWESVRAQLDAQRLEYKWAFSKDADDVEVLARSAASFPGTLVVGVGGDGTLQRIATAIVGSDAVLGIVPAGTGNDFARTMQIPMEAIAACNVLLHGQIIHVDLGRFNGRYFLNVLGTGLDAEVAAGANRRFKRFSGILGYMLSLLWQLIVYKPRQVQIVLDGEKMSCQVWLVAVANACYYGGGMKVAPGADPGDGLADVVVVGKVSRLRFLQIFPRVYSGRHIAHPAVSVFRAASVEITADRVLAAQADGEPAGSTPISVKMERHAIRLRVPVA